MDFIFQFVFWLLTFVLGFVGFANVGLPVFYGIPQSISWFRAGSVRIGAVRGYFITCIIWSVLLTIAISIMYLIFSLFVDRIVTIGLAGAALGFLFGVFQSLTASGRESLRSDFHRAMSKHLNYDETNNNKSILAGRMDDTTLEREISIALVSDDFEQAAELGTQIVAQFLGEIPAVQLGKLV